MGLGEDENWNLHLPWRAEQRGQLKPREGVGLVVSVRFQAERQLEQRVMRKRKGLGWLVGWVVSRFQVEQQLEGMMMMKRKELGWLVGWVV